MKKVLSLLLSIVMVFSAGIMGASAAAANAEEENLCEVFEELADFYYVYKGISPFSLYTIAGWTSEQIPNFHDDYYYLEMDEEGNPIEGGYKVPADLFDEYVNKYFALDEDFRTLVEKDKESEIPFITYDESTDKYIFSIGGWGGPVSYYYGLVGYTKETDTYTVYISKLPKLFDDLQYMLDYEGTTVEELGDRLKTTEDGKYYMEIPEEQKVNIKITVAYNGEYTKILESVQVDTIPESSEMITPIEKPTENPQVDYDVPDGIEIEGDTAFEEGTIVKVESIASGEIYERVEKALSNIAVADKIAVFEFSATKDNATVQPNGKVKVSFDLPANLSADNLKMFYVTEDSKTEEIAITVDKENKTVTAELEHFSTYVLCNVKTTPPTDTDTTNGNDTTSNETTNPQTGETTNIALCAVLMFASLSALAVLTYIKKKQHNH